jgi:putative transposase
LIDFGGFATAVARGLKLRHDHGSQYMSDHFQKEIAFLGIESSPAFVRAPEGNGCAERSGSSFVIAQLTRGTRTKRAP